MIALQYMLLQADDQKILHLLPAWPTEWDVEFKLHAPGQTIVECEFRNGKVRKLIATVNGHVTTAWREGEEQDKTFDGAPPYRIDVSKGSDDKRK